LGANSKGVVLGLPDAGAVQLSFIGGGVDASATNPNTAAFGYTDDNKVLSPPAAQNGTRMTLTIHRSTGAVGGVFTLTESAPPLVRARVPFFGQVVRVSDGSVKAAGHFLLPQIPVGTQKPNATPILSGLFQMTQ